MVRAVVVGLMLVGMAATAGAEEVDVTKVVEDANAAAARGEYADARRMYRWCSDLAETMKGRKLERNATPRSASSPEYSSST